MSKLTRTLILGAALAAMNLAGMTAVAQAQPDDPDGKQARRQATQERFSTPRGTPAQAPAPEPAEPSGQPGWLVPLLAVLAVSGGLAVMAAKRASRRVRAGHA